MSIDAALVGSAAACWMAGPRLCTADRPGACRPLIGNGAGGAGSAWATVWPPSVSAADAPTAISSVLIDDMTLPVVVCGACGQRGSGQRCGREDQRREPLQTLCTRDGCGRGRCGCRG